MSDEISETDARRLEKWQEHIAHFAGIPDGTYDVAHLVRMRPESAQAILGCYGMLVTRPDLFGPPPPEEIEIDPVEPTKVYTIGTTGWEEHDSLYEGEMFIDVKDGKPVAARQVEA